MRLKRGIELLLLIGLLLLAVACATSTQDAPTPSVVVEEIESVPPDAPATAEVNEPLEPREESTATPAPATPTAPAAREGQAVSPIGLPVQGTEGFPWWNDTVWYEIFVRSFYDSDGDGVGDLQGIIQKLDYLNDGDPTTSDDLGITGIWLMPIFESPSYHGYDVVDYYKVDEEYGTADDFKQLMAAAHERGIRIIVDMVLNHTSTEHPWFKEALAGNPEYESWYRFVEGEQPRQFAPWGGSNVWQPAGADRYYYALYWEGMPDLNYENPDVTAQMYDVSRFWLEEMGVDGFRLDGAAHLVESGQQVKNTALNHEWFVEYHNFVRSLKPDSVLVGEVWYPSNEIVPYLEDGGLDLAFEFTMATNLIEAARGSTAGPLRIGYGLANNLYPPLQYAPFLTNHDNERIASTLGGDQGKLGVAAAVLLTGPGSPFLYYGEEVAMPGKKPDENLRLPMPWNGEKGGGFSSETPWRALPAGYEQNNVETMRADPASLLNRYRQLIHLRNDHEALRAGEYIKVDTSSSNLFAFVRQSANETLLVLHNMTAEPISDYSVAPKEAIQLADGAPPELLHGAAAAPAEVDGEGNLAPYTPIATLDPYSSYVIQLRP